MSQTGNEALLERIRLSFERQTMMASFGAELVSASPGRCVISSPIPSTALQQHGAGHGGLTFALGDAAAGYAALTMQDDGLEVMTVEMKINLMSPAVGSRLVASGEVVRAGRRLTVVRAEVVATSASGNEKVVALLQGTMIPVPPAQEASG